jgi:hypothetical protein
MNRHLSLLAILLVLLLCACAQPLPAERQHYVGQWRGDGMELSIGADGRVVYKRSKGASSTSIDAPLQRFEGDDFFVGIGPLDTRFEVSSPPREVDGVWRMTVDGVELVRHGSPPVTDDSGKPLTPT